MLLYYLNAVTSKKVSSCVGVPNVYFMTSTFYRGRLHRIRDSAQHELNFPA